MEKTTSTLPSGISAFSSSAEALGLEEGAGVSSAALWLALVEESGSGEVEVMTLAEGSGVSSALAMAADDSEPSRERDKTVATPKDLRTFKDFMRTFQGRRCNAISKRPPPDEMQPQSSRGLPVERVHSHSSSDITTGSSEKYTQVINVNQVVTTQWVDFVLPVGRPHQRCAISVVNLQTGFHSARRRAPGRVGALSNHTILAHSLPGNLPTRGMSWH